MKRKIKKAIVEKEEQNSLQALQAAKAGYKEKGDVDCCNDWLAKELRGKFTDEDGFNTDAFIECLIANEVETEGKWAQNRNAGWKGRFRMNGRQKLEVMVAEHGFLAIHGKKIKVPPRMLGSLRKLHHD